MKFIIRRASSGPYLGGGPSPTPGAVQVGDRWEIELNSLEELRALADKVGDLVFNSDDFSSGIPSLMIYDGYIE